MGFERGIGGRGSIGGGRGLGKRKGGLGHKLSMVKSASKRKLKKLTALFSNTKSLNFDGTNDYGDISYVSGMDFMRTGDFTWAGWIKLGELGQFQLLMNNWSSFNNGWSLRFFSNNKLYWLSNGSAIGMSTAFNDSDWHHVVFAMNRSGSEAKWYVNGSLETTATSIPSAPSSTGNFRFGGAGHNPGTWRFEGKLDEIAVWNSVLDADNVTALYGSGAPPFSLTADSGDYNNSSNLYMYYSMGDNAGDDHTAIVDQGSGGNNVTLYNMDSSNISTDVPS